jgi:hypothetical protein
MLEALTGYLYGPLPSRAEQHGEFPFLLALWDAFGVISNTGEFLRISLRRTTASIYRSLVRCNSPSAAVVEELRTIRVPGNFPQNYEWKLRNVG